MKHNTKRITSWPLNPHNPGHILSIEICRGGGIWNCTKPVRGMSPTCDFTTYPRRPVSTLKSNTAPPILFRFLKTIHLFIFGYTIQHIKLYYLVKPWQQPQSAASLSNSPFLKNKHLHHKTPAPQAHFFPLYIGALQLTYFIKTYQQPTILNLPTFENKRFKFPP